MTKAEYNRQYHRAKYADPEYRKKAIVRATEWAKRNPQKRAEIDKRRDVKRRLLTPEKLHCKQAVAQQVYRGKRPAARELPCSVCGGSADHYHHHNGYSSAHRYDVIPVCIKCHVAEDRKQRKSGKHGPA